MKVTLEYDVVTGTITDKLGIIVGTYCGLTSLDDEQSSTSVDDMIKLKNSGFTAEEVIAIKKANL